jgi:hypothetical protein
LAAGTEKERDLYRRKPSSPTALPPWLSGGDSRPEGGGITVFEF